MQVRTVWVRFMPPFYRVPTRLHHTVHDSTYLPTLDMEDNNYRPPYT